MAFLTIQIGIALRDIGRITVIQVGIQIPDARTVDTHVITQTQVGHIRQLPADAGEDYIVEILLEVIRLCLKDTSHSVWYARSARPDLPESFFTFQGITGIGSQNNHSGV